MQRTNGLHPLLTAAAVSITVFSALGVASLTGLIPASIGSQNAEVEIASVAQPRDTPPAAQPAPKPVNKAVRRLPKSQPVEPVVYRDFDEAPVYSQAPGAVETPRPALVQPGNLGTVQAVREVKQAGEHTAMGPIAGGVAGAVIGSQIGGGSGKKIMTVVGALGGAMAGKHIEKQARATSRWEIDVRHDSGLQETVLSDAAPAYRPGDRVRVVEGRLQPA